MELTFKDDTVLSQKVSDWSFGSLLTPHFGNLAYRFAVQPESTSHPVRDYFDDETLWQDLRLGPLGEHGGIMLHRFRLFDYVPRAPGLYHDGNARFAREEAFRYLDDRLGDAPAHADAAAARDYTKVFAPQGKQSMLEGGIGCVRLRPIVIGDEVFQLMSATSSDEAHRGIPVAVGEADYLKVNERIGVDGVVLCDLQGRLVGVPPELVELFGNSPGCPRLYLRVDDLRICENLPPPERPQVSVAVSFTSDYQRRNGIYASYVTFTPGDNPTFDRALTWLNDVYVEEGYQGKIITDFDQSRSWFDGAALSLGAVMRRSRSELDQRILELMHARGMVDQLFDALEREEMVQLLGGRVRTKAFVSYSHRDADWLERLSAPLAAYPEIDLRVWDDRQIRPGTRWRNSIAREIGTAKVAVLLVSQDFLDSDFIQHAELPKLLEDEEREGLVVFTLFVDECNLTATPYLQVLQSLNSPARPLDAMTVSERDDVLLSAAEHIRSALISG